MGVQGLWQLLQSAGQPVTLESLTGKVLAVDVSMWLHQAGKGMRDRHGNAVLNAHLIVLFRRVCKLLYYQIKPVFVFDGGVPLLKKQTLSRRRQQREDAILDADQTAKKLALKLVQKQALNLVLNPSAEDTKLKRNGSTSRSCGVETDIFDLPPLPEHLSAQLNENGQPNSWEQRMEQRDTIFDHFEDIEQINTESEDFAALPAEIKHEILTDLKDIRRRMWMRSQEMPTDSDEFSKYQLDRLMKQSRLSQHLSRVRKELNTKCSGDLAFDVVGTEVSGVSVEASRVFSEDASHYFLIKGLRDLKETTDDSKCETSEPSGFPSIDQTELCSDDSADEDLERRKKYVNRALEESVHSVSLPSSYKDAVVRVGAETVDLSDEESDANDDDCREKSGIEQKRKLPQDLSVDKKKLKLENNTSEIVSTNMSKNVEMRDENKETAGNISSSLPGDDLRKESRSNHMDAEDRGSLLQSNVALLGDEKLPSAKEENFVVADKEDDSESSDDEGFIEVEPDSACAAWISEVCSSEEASLISESKLSKPVDSDAEEAATEKTMDECNPLTLEPDETSQSGAFGGICQNDLIAMQESIEDEMQYLQQERGKKERMATSITDQIQAEAQELLNLFGVPYVISPMEAEAQCAYLDMTNQTEGTVTDDSDIWLFGGHRVYRNMFNQNHNVEVYTQVDVKSKFSLDRADLIKMALLCGSDYTDGLQGIGPVGAVEILAEFPGEGIQSLVKFREWWDETQNQSKVPQETKIKSKLRKVKLTEGFPNAAVFYAYLHPAVDESEEPFFWSKPDLDLLRRYGSSKLGWSQSQVDELLLPLLKSLNQSKIPQSSITDFFQQDSKDVRGLKSRRLRNVINRMKTQNKNMQCDELNCSLKSSKGKVTKGQKTKNRKGKSAAQSCTSNGGRSGGSGGFVSSSNRVQAEVNLSEDSSDEDSRTRTAADDDFEVSDEVLAAIDIDEHLPTADSASFTGSSNKRKNTKAKPTKKSRTKQSCL